MTAGHNISIVLCRVKESGNVGSVCRAMKTMGFSKLVLADCPDYEEEKVRMMAVHAFDVFEHAQHVSSLDLALSSSALSAGFSRRKGEHRKSFFMSLRPFIRSRLLSLPSDTPVSFVFGNERDGLSDSELALCSLGVSIPTSESFPSLNIAQAVQIACWEVFSAFQDSESSEFRAAEQKPTVPAKTIFLSRAQVDERTAAISTSLAQIGFFKKSSDEYARRFFRDMIERAQLSKLEADYLAQIFSKAAILASHEGKPRRKIPHDRNESTSNFTA